MSWSPPGDTGQTLIPGLHGYTDLQLIAHGSTAMVFRATQIRLNRTVAIKVLLVDDVMTTAANVARELETTVALSSQPHIVSIIDTGVTDDGSPFIVMEYCEGGSYAQILKRRGPLPVDEVLDVGVKIGEALHAAHEVGIIHRDVKPPNILRSRFGPALTDFGIARAADDGGVATSTLDKLTPQHASPEAMLRDPQSGLSDLYSLASTMWNLLAGRAPFTDPNQPYFDPMSFRERVLIDPVPRVPRDDLPEWLQHELAKAMEKNPNDRHASAGAFAETLRLHGSRTALAPWPQQPAQPVQEPVSSVDADVPTQTTGDSAPPAADVSPASAPPVVSEPPAAVSGPPATAVPPPAAVPPGPTVPPGPPPVVWPTSGPVRITRPEVEEPDVHSPATELVAPPSAPPEASAPSVAPAWPPQSAEPPASPQVSAPHSAPPAPHSAPPYSAPPASGPPYPAPPVSAPPHAIAPQSAPPAPHSAPLATPASAPPYSAPPVPHSAPPAPPGPGFDLTAELTYLPDPPAPPTSAPPSFAHPAPAPPAPTPWPPPPPAPTSAPPMNAPHSAPPGWPQQQDPASAPPALFPQSTEYSTPAPTPAAAGPTSWPQPTRRTYLKPLLIAVAIGTVLGLTALLGLLVVQGKDDPGTDQRADPTATPSTGPSGGITLTKEGAPTNLVVDDRGTSVILNWVDTTGGRAPFIIFSARTGQQTKAVGRELQGQTSHVVDGLNPKADYCFVVTAAVSVEVLANSDSVCTRRLGANASEPAATPS